MLGPLYKYNNFGVFILLAIRICYFIPEKVQTG